MTTSSSIPTVDISRAKSDRQETATQLVRALEDVGFLFLDNVEGFDPDELYRATVRFFNLPEERKKDVSTVTWNPKSKHVYRGYFPAEEGASSHKEGFEITEELDPDDPDVKKIVLYETNQWPVEDATVPFRQIMTKYYTNMDRTALEVTRLIALGLGRDENTFDELFLTKPLSTLRLISYPPRKEEPPPESKDGDLVLQCNEHVDGVFLTFLSTFHHRGLQILTKEGKWAYVEPRPNSLVVNIGEILAKMSKNRLKATKHRVIYMGEWRYSLPFFYEPCYRGDMNKYFRAVGMEEETPPYDRYGPWLIRHLKRDNVEYQKTDFGEIEL